MIQDVLPIATPLTEVISRIIPVQMSFHSELYDLFIGVEKSAIIVVRRLVAIQFRIRLAGLFGISSIRDAPGDPYIIERVVVIEVHFNPRLQ